MAFGKYNTEEAAAAVFEKLVPEFSRLSKDLSEISQFLDRLQVSSNAENQSPEKESDFEKMKQELDFNHGY